MALIAQGTETVYISCKSVRKENSSAKKKGRRELEVKENLKELKSPNPHL